MKINIKNMEINYIQYGKGEKNIVLLHGWGQNILMMQPLGDPLSENYKVTMLDLPGFGDSMEPQESWTIYDYCDMLEEFLHKLKIENPILMGHSFGGRISICYAARNNVEKLILFGSPCIRKDVKPSLKVRVLKAIKKVPGFNKLSEEMKKYIGSHDYKAASPIMRQVLVNVVNQDLSESAKKINAPTLLIWGDMDTEAPLDDAIELEKIMKDAGLIVFPGCTHYAYLENLQQVLKILKEFL